jgi:hypothetical protein
MIHGPTNCKFININAKKAVENSKRRKVLQLKMILMKWVVRDLSGFVWLRLKTIGGSFTEEI